MILGPWYAFLGLCLFFAASDPAANKLLLSWSMWGSNLVHGLVAISSCFYATTPVYSGPSIVGALLARAR